MPKRRVVRRSSRKRVRRGGSFFKKIGRWLSGAHRYVKKKKWISRVGTRLAPWMGPQANALVNVAKQFGYGRRKCGRGIGLAGSGLRLAGAGRRRYKRR